MELFRDFDIQLFLNEMNCDAEDLIDVVEDKLKVMNTQKANFNRYTDLCGIKDESKKIQTKNDPSEKIDNKKYAFTECYPKVPEGWKTRTYPEEGGQKTLYLSPTGTCFNSRRRAYCHMLAGGYTEKQVEEMKHFVKLDGWKEDPSLPRGWMAKRTKRYAYFLNGDGKLLKSVREAEEYMQTGKIKHLKIKAQTDDHASMQNNLLPEGWIKNEFLPEGWMFKKPKSNFQYIWVKSREGKTFKSTKQVVSFLNTSEEYSNQDVERFSLFPDGVLNTYAKIDGREWLENDYLPDGWKFKKPRSRSNPHYIWVKSREGILYKSAKQVVNFLNASVEYSNKDVQRFSRFPDGEFKKSTKTKASNQNRQHVSKKKNPKCKTQNWLKSENLPEGWLYKEHNRSYAVCAKSPNGTIFNSYSAITNFLKDNKNFTEKDLNNLVLFQQEYREKFPPTKGIRRENLLVPSSSHGLM